MSIQLSQHIVWETPEGPQTRRWYSEAGLPPPNKIMVVDDTTTANALFRLAQSGTALLWRGDYQNARQTLSALVRRLDKPKRVGSQGHRDQEVSHLAPPAIFEQHRAKQRERAQILGQLLIPISKDFEIQLRRGQAVKEALSLVLEPSEEDLVMSLRGLLAIISAFEWYKKGTYIPVLGQSITPSFGVFSPVRSEYIELVAKHPLPTPCDVAFDVGTGSGVLAAVLAKRGISKIIATDLAPRAIACASMNIARLGYSDQVTLLEKSLMPDGQANLIVCNPPWVPAIPSSPVEAGVYDPDSNFLRGFLSQVVAHLLPQGRAWLILSDLAEHLELRSRANLLQWIQAAGLQVISKTDITPHHPKTRNQGDALYFARSKEVTSLWELAPANY